MFTVKIFNKIRPQRQIFCTLQRSLDKRMKSNKPEDDSKVHKPAQNDPNLTLGQMGSKYQVFRDQDSEVILDIYEERNKYASLLEAEEEEEDTDEFAGISLERNIASYDVAKHKIKINVVGGTSGVYEIEDLVQVLRRENCENIFVASVPKEIKYVDYICIVSGKSQKHMQAIAQFVRKVYKRKRHETDIVPRLEGASSKDWMALDLGNIALHIFSREARTLYDLDSLWALGSQYDTEYNKKDPVVEMMEKHSLYLQDLQPAS